MKKFYNLLAVIMIAVMGMGVQSVSAQTEPIYSEDFSSVTTTGTQQCHANGTAFTATTLGDVLPGWSSEKAYAAGGKIKLGTSSVNGWIETPSIDLTNYGSVRITFDAKAWNTSNGTDGTTMTVYVNSNAYTVEGLPNVGSTDTTTEGFCDMGSFEILAAAGGPTTIRFEASPRAFIDNIAIYPATQPAISVVGNTTFTNVSVNQACNTTLVAKGFNLTAGGNTTVTLTGSEEFTTEVATVANNDLMTEDGVSIPVSFVSAAAGNFNATLSLSNTDLTDAVVVELSVSVIDILEVPTIAELRTLIDYSDVTSNSTDTVFYKYTGHAYVTQVAKTGSYSKWIQDETGAIQLYDPNGHLSNVSEGQEITNVIGKLANYYGYLELNVQSDIANSDINAFPTNIPTPIALTLEQLQDQDYMNTIQGQLIKLEDVTINATGTFTKYVLYTVTQNGVTDTAIYVTSTYDTQCGSEIPTGTVSIIGVNTLAAAYSAGYGSERLASRYYIIPRTFENGSSIAENEAAMVSVYPNPFEESVMVEAGETATNVAVYNVFGKMVANQAVSAGLNTIQLNNLAAGVYVLRVFSDNQVVGTAKIIKK